MQAQMVGLSGRPQPNYTEMGSISSRVDGEWQPDVEPGDRTPRHWRGLPYSEVEAHVGREMLNRLALLDRFRCGP